MILLPLTEPATMADLYLTEIEEEVIDFADGAGNHETLAHAIARWDASDKTITGKTVTAAPTQSQKVPPASRVTEDITAMLKCARDILNGWDARADK